MAENELNEVLRLHMWWLNCKGEGKKADLSDVDLRRAFLNNADLSYANLRESDLADANLSYADLSGVDLCDANLRGANLSEAKCGFDAFFGSANGAPIYQTVCGFGSRNAALTLLAQGKRADWRWFTGCFSGSEDKLRKAVAKEHGNSKAGRGYLLAIDYLVAQAELNAKDATNCKKENGLTGH